MKPTVKWIAASLLVIAVAGSVGLYTMNRKGGMSAPMSGTHAHVGALVLTARLEPDPPRERGNRLTLLLVDAQKRPVEHATLDVMYVMPAMGAMAEMKGKATITDIGDGRYEAAFDLPMAGSWSLRISATATAGAGTAEFGMTVGRTGLTLVHETAMPKAEAPMVIPPLVDMAMIPAHSAKPLAPLPNDALAPMKQVFTTYDRVRDLLARDQLADLAPAVSAITAAITAVKAALPSDHPVTAWLAGQSDQVRLIGAAKTLDEAREHFGNLSHCLVAIAEADPRLQAGLSIFRCPMADGYHKWIQGSPKLANPYMGTDMLTCGAPTDWRAADDVKTGTKPTAAAIDGKDVAFYTCSMHPSVKQQTNSACPICSMDVVAVTKQQVATGEIMIDDQRRQLIGVRTQVITKQPMRLTVRASARITYEESSYTDVSLKVSGWITTLFANTTGGFIEKGQPLMMLYSPELYVAQQEFLLAMRAGQPNGRIDEGLHAATREKLHLWDVSDAQIEKIAKAGRAERNLAILAPASGYLIDKQVAQGAAVIPGQRLFRIAPIERVWVLADIFETDVSAVKIGQSAVVTLPYLPGKTVTGTIDYLYPALHEGTRSVRARIVLENADHQLRPEMYATVTINIELGERLLVPKSAVVYTGPRRLVFIDKGEGRLRPAQVTLGVAGDTGYEVLSGLAPGDTVVTSGNFLVAAESRIRSAEQYWGSDHDAK